MNVLSLFDGISCARVALDRAGIEVCCYLSSEIDKHAIKVSEKNYPDIIRVGSIVNLSVEGEIDLLIGGSPCQDLSIAKKDRKGLDGDRSGLFWQYVRLKNECKPKWFVLENVASMPKKDRDIITREMGVEPVMFNASLVSAQSRKRLFWTNIPFELPADRGILLKDILQDEVEEKFFIDKVMTSNGKTTGKVGYIGEGEQYGQGPALVKLGHVGNGEQGNRVYDTNGKSATLSATGGGLGAKTGLYKIGRDIGRRLNAEGHRADEDTKLPYQRRIETREDDKCGTLTSVTKDNLVVGDKIRKLTPIECERLQGLPDNYTEGVATTNRYKCLGNAFNVDVVTHILAGLRLLI
jgi:DNA-cytosine methyltransferase